MTEASIQVSRSNIHSNDGERFNVIKLKGTHLTKSNHTHTHKHKCVYVKI